MWSGDPLTFASQASSVNQSETKLEMDTFFPNSAGVAVVTWFLSATRQAIPAQAAACTLGLKLNLAWRVPDGALPG